MKLNKIITLCTVCALSFSLVACGTTNENVTSSTNETESEIESIVSDTEETIDYAPELTYTGDAYVIVPNEKIASWSVADLSDALPEEERIISVDTIDDGNGVLTTTITPKKAGTSIVEFTGMHENFATIVTYTITVHDDLSMEIMSDVMTNEVITEEPVELDEDLNNYITTYVEALNASDIGVPMISSQMIDVANVDSMTYNFGVETLTGLEKASLTESLISPSTFSSSVLKFDTNENATAAVDTLVSNAQLNKWVCSSAEKADAKVVDDTYVVFVMGTDAQISTVLNCF